jgi:hypothetical protein
MALQVGSWPDGGGANGAQAGGDCMEIWDRVLGFCF